MVVWYQGDVILRDEGQRLASPPRARRAPHPVDIVLRHLRDLVVDHLIQDVCGSGVWGDEVLGCCGPGQVAVEFFDGLVQGHEREFQPLF